MIIILLALGYAAAAYFAYKSFHLRDEVASWRAYHDSLLEKLNALQEDYPGAEVYQEENRRLIESSSPEERKNMIVLYGASITRRWDLEKYLPGKKLINRGVGSQSTTQLLSRFSTDVLSVEPGGVVIKLCAGNFTPEANVQTMWDEYESMVVMARQRGIEPIMTTVIPVTRAAEKFSDFNITETVKEFNSRITAYASSHKLRVVDYFGAMADEQGFLPNDMARDEIHPNENGYEIMARTIAPIIEQ